MATTFETGSDEAENDLVDLEPTMQYPLPGAREAGGGPKPSAGVAIHEGSITGSTGEIQRLRQDRLRSASLFLAVAYFTVFVWVLMTSEAKLAWIVLILSASRVVVAGVIAALLWREPDSAPSKVRILEYVLFGSMTAILMIGQYTVNVDLLERGDLIGATSYIKNGVIQMFILMCLYGAFIPNSPRVTAEVVLTMALAPIIALVFLMEAADLNEVINQMRLSSHEHAGSNALILMIGAALAIYTSYTLNSLRAEIDEAKKFGQYQLRGKIGSGGMGDVYLAEHSLLKRPCAIKLIKGEAVTNPLSLARFEREVQSTARLSHPNTIEIFDYGHTDDGTFYYVMEYLQGMSLAELAHLAGPLPAGRAIYIMKQVCAGLSEAHLLGLVHRDLKPANLFVALRGGEADVAKVLDFGLVKVTKEANSAELAAELTVSGTPLYMAPEQAGGDLDLDARADIYALGAILYATLTGRPPFLGDTPFAVMMANANDEVTPPSKHNPAIPADLEAVVLRCLAKKPDDRYQDVKALGKALASCEAAADWDAEKAELWWANPGLAIAGKA